MKILIFEYITGGGFNKQDLPDALSQEGQLMLQALLDNFLELSGVELVVMLDQRLLGQVDAGHHEIVVINKTQDCRVVFAKLTQQSDAVWPIAPESDGILQTLCASVEDSGKRLLTSPSTAVGLTGNKYRTYQHLQKHAIATVPTCLLAPGKTVGHPIPAAPPHGNPGQWVIKPLDGVGCADSWIIDDLQAIDTIRHKERYLIQPHLQGKKTSLSCILKKGQAWIVCVNEQHFDIVGQQYHLSHIEVNSNTDIGRYQSLADDIAHAFQDLWGYVGIDLIETPDNIWVLEINPRLTTSFVGIKAALGINIADIVLHLNTATPTIKPLCNKPNTVTVTPNTHAH